MPFGYRRNPGKYGRARRNSRVGKILRRRLNSGYSRRTVAKARRISRVLGKYGRSSARLRRSSTRTGRPALPRGFFRRRFRGSRMLSRKVHGPINASWQYRNKGRRAYHLSKRFKKRVDLHTGHTLRYTDVENVNLLGVNGKARYYVMDLGSAVDNDTYIDYAKKHWAGYKVVDPNTTANAVTQFKMKVKVLSIYKNLYMINSSNTKSLVQVFGLTPRHDIHKANLMPPAVLTTYFNNGDLPDATTVDQNVSDIAFNVFHCPALTQNWKISKTKSFWVHGGGNYKLNLSHSYDINSGLDSQAFGWDTTVVAKKGHYRALLVRVVGDLGVVLETAPSEIKHIRNLPFEHIGRETTSVKLHVSTETRDIYLDEHIPVTREIAAPGGIAFQAEELQIEHIPDPLLPNTTD